MKYLEPQDCMIIVVDTEENQTQSCPPEFSDHLWKGLGYHFLPLIFKSFISFSISLNK